jgi:hypothetical protein
MNPELELVLDMQIMDEVEGDADTLLPKGTFTMKITHASFYSSGNEITDKNAFAFSLFLATPDESEFRRTGKQTCKNIFRPIDNHGFSLANVLVAQLSLREAGERIDWHRILTKPLPSSGLELRQSLRQGIDHGFIKYVMDIVPNTWPDFLGDQSAFLRSRQE